MQRAPCSSDLQRALDIADGDGHGAAGLGGDAGGDQLGAHAAGGVAGRWFAAHGLDLGGDGFDDGDVAGVGVAAGVGGVEAVDVGQQDQLVGLDHFGDAGGEAVVVAEADFGGGDGVVFVDDGDAAERQQGAEGLAGVEVAAAVLGVAQGQQELGGGEVVGGQRLGPGLGEADLADGGGGLFFLQFQAFLGEAEGAPGQGDGAGGDDDDFGAALAQGGDVGGDAVEPGGAGGGLFLVDDEGAADLDDDARCARDRRGSRGLLLPLRLDGVLQGAENLGHALAGGAGQQVDGAAGGFPQGGHAGGGFTRGHGVGLVQADDFGLFGQAAAVGGHLAADGAPGFDHVAGGAVDQMEQDGAAFDMAEEAVAEAGAFMGALDQAGDVGEDEFLGGGQADDAELGVQGGEGVVGDFGSGGGDDGQEGGFAGVGQADEAGVGDQLQAQPDPAFLAGPALGDLAGRAVGGGLEVGVAEAAIAAAQQGDPFAGGCPGRRAGFPGRRRKSGCRWGR